ncbi:aminotransferase class I/II-fold pyridoxal phosphate-dependent enzyme [Candidatus Parvarchaeota archaeon]|nr:aminotransferase class I/II-fold pyridoxal phosphate-dependent enzyme [Candidatus Parvarchaeota archaeon]
MVFVNFDEYLKSKVDEKKSAGLDWKLRRLGGMSVPRCKVEGKDVLMLCSNNYLGLSSHKKIIRAQITAAKQWGAGSGSVRVIAGTMDLHTQLEEKIAKFKHTPAALYFQTGFAANAGTIPAISGEGDLLVSDELNHGSIIDGVRLSKAQRTIYKHADAQDLARVLEEAATKGYTDKSGQKQSYNRLFVLTDGVFSMDGDVAPLDKITPVAKKHGAIIYVDDAHGDGVLGECGRGAASHFGLEGKIDIEMGTFSKALGVVGGYVSGSQALHDFLWNNARTFLLSGSAPPATVAGCMAALDIMESEPRHLKKLWKNTKYFKKQMKGAGFDTGNSTTPITPVMCGESIKAQNLSAELFEQGVFALPIVFPMVAKDKARIRVMMNAQLSTEDLELAVEKFVACGKKTGVLQG